MAKKKLTMRKVIHMQKWGETTRFGNPERYRLLLECGHISFAYYSGAMSIKWVIWNFSREKDEEPYFFNRRCDACRVKQPIQIRNLILGDLEILEEGYILDIREQMVAYMKDKKDAESKEV